MSLFQYKLKEAKNIYICDSDNDLTIIFDYEKFTLFSIKGGINFNFSQPELSDFIIDSILLQLGENCKELIYICEHSEINTNIYYNIPKTIKKVIIQGNYKDHVDNKDTEIEYINTCEENCGELFLTNNYLSQCCENCN